MHHSLSRCCHHTVYTYGSQCCTSNTSNITLTHVTQDCGNLTACRSLRGFVRSQKSVSARKPIPRELMFICLFCQPAFNDMKDLQLKHGWLLLIVFGPLNVTLLPKTQGDDGFMLKHTKAEVYSQRILSQKMKKQTCTFGS